MADQYDQTAPNQTTKKRLGGFYNSFRYQANRALTILPNLSVGRKFNDTLGHFYPFAVDANGGITLSGSSTTPGGALTFHNTAVAGTDETVVLNDTGALFIAPNSATSVDNHVIIADSTAATYIGFVFYPALTSGGTTQPELDVSTPSNFLTIYRYETNYLQFTGGTTGFGTSIYALGGDTDINLFLHPKGAGVVGFQYAQTSLGGGSTASFGTIGGSGPATAGQNSWLQVVVNGNYRWIPLWA